MHLGRAEIASKVVVFHGTVLTLSLSLPLISSLYLQQWLPTPRIYSTSTQPHIITQNSSLGQKDTIQTEDPTFGQEDPSLAFWDNFNHGLKSLFILTLFKSCMHLNLQDFPLFIKLHNLPHQVEYPTHG